MNRRREIEEERRREAEAVLARTARDTESVMDGAAKSTADRLGDHFGGADAAPGDAIDLWGKRIGRLLALVAALLLIVHLVRTYGA
jgi:hypothetical protein